MFITAHVRPVVVLLGVLLLAGPAAYGQDAAAEKGDEFPSTLARGDFNGDGYQDVAIGVPSEDVTTTPWSQIVNAGAVEVIYGTASGLASANRQFWTQGALDLADGPETGDTFGSALAAGDFNGDGFDDLAIGAPGESIGGVNYAGVVHVVYGSPSGLSTTAVPEQVWHQDSPDVVDRAEPLDYFGSSLTAGRFNGDRFADLVVGVPGEDSTAGAVHVLYGSAAGLSPLFNRTFRQASGTDGLLDVGEAFDFLGRSLASGDFNCDGHDDVAIGVPDESDARGAVNVVYGAPAGLRLLNNQFFDQDALDVEDEAAIGEFFGASFAAGDFNGDGCGDLAIGVHGEDIPALVDGAGAVHVLYGSSPFGLSTTFAQFWYQGFSGVKDQPEAYDGFGTAMTSGDFNGDGYQDLAIGVPGEDVGWIDGVGPIGDAGAVNVIYGSATGLSFVIASQLWHQDVAGVEDLAERFDYFGRVVMSGDFNGDGRDDLTVGVPDEDLYGVNGSVEDAGAMNVIYGSPIGLSTSKGSIPDQFWSQTVILPPQP